jgi:hypothetical protein
MIAEPRTAGIRALADRDPGRVTQVFCPQLPLYNHDNATVNGIGNQVLQNPFRERIKLG